MIRYVILGCSLALLAPLMFPLLTGRIFTKDDLAALHLPFRFLYQQSLQSGEFLLWTPAYHSGFYLHGAGEAGMAHPLHLLLYRFLPLGIAFNIEIISSYLFMFFGCGIMLARLGLTREAAWFGAMNRSGWSKVLTRRARPRLYSRPLGRAFL